MALPTVSDCKAFVGKQTTDEDTLFTSLLARAIAAVERKLGYPLTATSRAYVDYEEFDNYGVAAVLQLPGPFAADPAVVDKDGTSVSATTYNQDRRTGRLIAKDGYSFPARPYTITATIGLSSHPDYAASLEAVISAAVIDLVAHYYLNRNPAATSEGDEGGGSKSVETGEIPQRIADVLEDMPCQNMGIA